MFHKIKDVYPLHDLKLSVRFVEGVTKIYEVGQLMERTPQFKMLLDNGLFYEVSVDVGGHGIIWNDDLDLSCNELWDRGVVVATPFDGLIGLSDATKLWGLNESTLRKALSYGKIVAGVDACKYGKQWVVTREAMFREYGEPS